MDAAAASEPWELTASRDVHLDGLEGQDCVAVAVTVPAGVDKLGFIGGSPSVSGSFPVPDGAGYVKVRLFDPSGQEVAMRAEEHDVFAPQPVQAGYVADVETPLAGIWVAQFVPNTADFQQTARLSWNAHGSSPDGEPPAIPASDQAC
jgi:hypothetical protein